MTSHLKQASEHSIQKSIIAYLDRTLPKTVRAIGVSNNPRSAIAGAKEKARGMRKGFPDIVLISQGGVCGLMEVKSEGGRLRPEQVEWRDWCGGNAVPYAVVRGIDDVAETLRDWRVTTRAAA